MTVLLIALLPAELAQTPPPAPWGWPLFIGMVATLGQMAQALKHAETLLMPFDLLRPAGAPLIGSIAFGQGPDVLTRVGCGDCLCQLVLHRLARTLRRADGAGVDRPPPRCAVHAGSPLAGQTDANSA